jgi:PHP C-terminal domain protein
MDLLFDLHTHTIASEHAYSTIRENIETAYERGLKAYGFSDHAPKLKGAPTDLYFINFRVIPREYKGMKVCAGIEANIIDFDGNIDVGGKVYERVDYIIASLHTLCIDPGTLDQNMRAYIGAMSNPYIKIIGHPDDPKYPIDHDELAKQAKLNSVAIEINNSSMHPESARKGARENILKLLKACEKYSTYIICGTDAHICYDIGIFNYAKEIIRETHFPKELVLNTSLENINYVLNRNKVN